MYAVFLILLLVVDTAITCFVLGAYRGVRRELDAVRRDLALLRAPSVGAAAPDVDVASGVSGDAGFDYSALLSYLTEHGMAGDLQDVSGDE